MSSQFFERRSTSQFTGGKFPALPGIGASSPQPSEEHAVVPASAATRHSMDAYEPDERLRLLETRVNVSEKSNRALLEEVVRLQSELKGTIKRNEEIIREERSTRAQLENSLRASNDLISQLSGRVLRAEERLTEEHSAVSALANHTKSVEQIMLGSQQELLSRRELQQTRLQELRVELDETVRAKDALEKVTYGLMDETRQLKAKLDAQASDFTTVALDLRNKSRKLEEETRSTRIESLRKQGEAANQTEQTTAQLRSQVEHRLTELRDVLVDLRNKQEKESQDRRQLEQQTQLKLSDLQAALTEQNRKREEALHALDVVQREKEHAAEHERIKLQGKIAEIAEEVSKKILQKEIKLRQESQDKFAALETMLLNEQVARSKFEQDQRNEQEKRWEGLKQLAEDEMNGLREAIKAEKKRNAEVFQRLNEAVNLIEQQVEVMKKENDKILGAEIKSRKQHQRETVSRIDDLHDKLTVATSALQQAIGGMQIKMEDENRKVKREMKARLDDQKESDTRTMADMDTRLLSLQRKLTNMEEDLEHKLQGIPRVEDRQRSLQLEVNSRVKEEADSRIRDVDNLKRDLDRLEEKMGRGQARQGDVEQCQQSIRKLAESIQTVKTVLGMKIQSEQKLRVDSIDALRADVSQLTHQVSPLINAPKSPRLFVKPDGWEKVGREKVERKSEAINRWNVYNVYRWHLLKTRWLPPYPPKIVVEVPSRESVILDQAFVDNETTQD